MWFSGRRSFRRELRATVLIGFGLHLSVIYGDFDNRHGTLRVVKRPAPRIAACLPRMGSPRHRTAYPKTLGRARCRLRAQQVYRRPNTGKRRSLLEDDGRYVHQPPPRRSRQAFQDLARKTLTPGLMMTGLTGHFWLHLP